jgi:hypothetical protein
MGQVLVRETGVKESSSISVHLKVKQDFFFLSFCSCFVLFFRSLTTQITKHGAAEQKLKSFRVLRFPILPSILSVRSASKEEYNYIQIQLPFKYSHLESRFSAC